MKRGTYYTTTILSPYSTPLHIPFNLSHTLSLSLPPNPSSFYFIVVVIVVAVVVRRRGVAVIEKICMYV